MSIFDGLIDRVLCVVGAVSFAQGPEFIQQYVQRLGGHLQEAQRQLSSFHDAAAQAGLPFKQFVAQTSANSDPGLSHLGTVMSAAADRTAMLQASYDALQQASPWSRPFAFFRHLEFDVAQATAAAYRPAVPTTIEGLVYAITGMLALLVLYRVLLTVALALWRLRSRRPKLAPAH